MATWDVVAEFLRSFKGAMDFEFFNFVSREKNLQGLLDLEMSINEAKEVIASLTPDNYWHGPEPDHDFPEEGVWFFGADIRDTEVYIKLKLVQDARKKSVRWAKVLGFHPAEGTITYPLRRSEK